MSAEVQVVERMVGDAGNSGEPLPGAPVVALTGPHPTRDHPSRSTTAHLSGGPELLVPRRPHPPPTTKPDTLTSGRAGQAPAPTQLNNLPAHHTLSSRRHLDMLGEGAPEVVPHAKRTRLQPCVEAARRSVRQRDAAIPGDKRSQRRLRWRRKRTLAQRPGPPKHHRSRRLQLSMFGTFSRTTHLGGVFSMSRNASRTSPDSLPSMPAVRPTWLRSVHGNQRPRRRCSDPAPEALRGLPGGLARSASRRGQRSSHHPHRWCSRRRP